MLRCIATLFVLMLLSATSASGSVDSRDDVVESLEFDVYLDKSKIGWHRYDIWQLSDGAREVRSEARFDVKFLLFTAFRYRHQNTEQWSDGCLSELESDTDSNGKRTVVAGQRTETGFVVSRDDHRAALPDCVMTFAYWNPDFLQQPKLLNAQTGEYLDVDVQQLDSEPIVIGGKYVDASPYRILAQGIEVKVWYSSNNEWLALESMVKGGRKIRYELS